MKVYFTAGLKEIAEAGGYRGVTLTSLERCSNFKRTHAFFLQVWEGIYRVMLMAYIEAKNQTVLLENIKVALQDAINETTPRLVVMKRLNTFITQKVEKSFLHFIECQTKVDEIWRFWSNFLFVDCQAYVYLFLSIRGSNWNLRNASLKSMVPTFAPFDRDVYQRLIPNHIAEHQIYPPEVLDFLKSGGFTVHLRGEK